MLTFPKVSTNKFWSGETLIEFLGKFRNIDERKMVGIQILTNIKVCRINVFWHMQQSTTKIARKNYMFKIWKISSGIIIRSPDLIFEMYSFLGAKAKFIKSRKKMIYFKGCSYLSPDLKIWQHMTIDDNIWQ